MAEFGRTDLVTVRRAATIVGRSDRTIRRLINECKLRAIRLGAGKGQLYVEVASLKDYMEIGNVARQPAQLIPTGYDNVTHFTMGVSA